MREILQVRQVAGELQRRWFTSDTMDLIVWCDKDRRPVAFQLCYDKGVAERALSWAPESGFSYMAVDDGEEQGGARYKATPILVADGEFDGAPVRDRFLENGRRLPVEIVDFVCVKIDEHRRAALP